MRSDNQPLIFQRCIPHATLHNVYFRRYAGFPLQSQDGAIVQRHELSVGVTNSDRSLHWRLRRVVLESAILGFARMLSPACLTRIMGTAE